MSHISFVQLFPMIVSYITIVHYQNQETNIGTILSSIVATDATPSVSSTKNVSDEVTEVPSDYNIFSTFC